MKRQTLVLLLAAGAAVALFWYFKRNGMYATPKGTDTATVKPGQTGGPVVQTIIDGQAFYLDATLKTGV